MRKACCYVEHGQQTHCGEVDAALQNQWKEIAWLPPQAAIKQVQGQVRRGTIGKAHDAPHTSGSKSD